ncbi:zf-HC2 domain-containing protein [Streptomyces sp. NPDC057743]|uniref:zf-HC2 domain-containing protein n=1 Tax=Streptomyces sp. NPDC057743 TaxID=3346236 RepID=UPI0036CD489E
MLCSRIRTALSARLDGEALPPGLTTRRLDDHLASCRDCRQWDARARALTVAIGSVAAQDAQSESESESEVESEVEMAARSAAGGRPTQASFEPPPEPFEPTSESVETLLARLRSVRRAG